MSRPLRIEYRGAWYHIMNRGRRGEPVFANRGDYRQFVELLKETTEVWNLRTAAYCLMPNHYHLLVQTPDGNISRCMRHIDGVYTQRFNQRHGCDGQLFGGRYKSILLDADSYLLQLVRYIHRNPLRAGLAKGLDRYVWSSHRGYLSRSKEWDWLHKEHVFSILSKSKANRLKRYQRFVSMEDEEAITSVYEGKRWPSVFGSERFVNTVKEKFFSRKVDEEVPQSKELAPGTDRIKRGVCEFYRIDQAELLRSRRGDFNEPRNVAIYLTRRLRGDSLKEIGEQFQMDKYSSVSSGIERMKALIAKDQRLRSRVEKLVLMLAKSQEQT